MTLTKTRTPNTLGEPREGPEKGRGSMDTTVRHGVVVLLLVLSAACGSSAPTSSTVTSQPPAQPSVPSTTPAPPMTFPPLAGPARIFIFDRQLSYPVSHYTRESRFVLYDSGGFALQYPSLGGAYRGGYTEANGVITLAWEGWSVAGPWGATGTIKGDMLTIQYNLIMQLTDFEDAVYARMP
jgi:ABC-type transport system substrate-binding protein